MPGTSSNLRDQIDVQARASESHTSCRLANPPQWDETSSCHNGSNAPHSGTLLAILVAGSLHRKGYLVIPSLASKEIGQFVEIFCSHVN